MLQRIFLILLLHYLLNVDRFHLFVYVSLELAPPVPFIKRGIGEHVALQLGLDQLPLLLYLQNSLRVLLFLEFE